jgi:hypothetical protein
MESLGFRKAPWIKEARRQISMKRNHNSFSFFKLTTPHSGAHPPPTTLRGVVRTGALGLTGLYAMNRVHAQPGSRIKERIIVDIGVFLLRSVAQSGA